MKKTALIPLMIFVAGCFTAKTVSTTSQSDVDLVRSQFPNYTLADLNHGHTLYTQHCGTCHSLKDPAGYSEDAWRKIVPNMVGKVNKNGRVLDEKAEQDILRYVITMGPAKDSEQKQ